MSKAYISVTERFEKPTCGIAECAKSESPEHWVDVRIGEDMINPIKAMLDALERVKAIEAEDWVCECHGKGKENAIYAPGEKCPACAVNKAIVAGQRLLKGVEGKAL